MPCKGRVGPLPSKLMFSVHGSIIRIDCENNSSFWMEICTKTGTVRGRGMHGAGDFVLSTLDNGYRVDDHNNPEFWVHVSTE